MTISRLGSHFDLTAVVQALQTARDARLLADPNVMVLDNERASISLISEIPYQQLTQTGQGGDIGTTGFKEAGIKLNVLPQVASDGTIQMTVEPEFSRLTGFTPEEGQPIIDRRTAYTRVRVSNGQTLVIGGLRQRADLGEFNGIPYLQNLKYVGKLFRGRESTVRESELVVFIRTDIVTPEAPLDWRQEAAHGTTLYRLDKIPTGDGYPMDNHFHGAGHVLNGYGLHGLDSNYQGVQPVIEPLDPQQYESIGPGDDLGAARSPSPSALPEPRPQVAMHNRITPLPSIYGPTPTGPDSILAARPTGAEAPRVASLSSGEPLRPTFEQRFRATGGVYPGDQRGVEPASPAAASPAAASPAAASPAPTPPKESFWGKILRF
jgi:hypothetical protein